MKLFSMHLKMLWFPQVLAMMSKGWKKLVPDKKNDKRNKANQKEKTSQELKSTSLEITKKKIYRKRSK